MKVTTNLTNPCAILCNVSSVSLQFIFNFIDEKQETSIIINEAHLVKMVMFNVMT